LPILSKKFLATVVKYQNKYYIGKKSIRMDILSPNAIILGNSGVFLDFHKSD